MNQDQTRRPEGRPVWFPVLFNMGLGRSAIAMDPSAPSGIFCRGLSFAHDKKSRPGRSTGWGRGTVILTRFDLLMSRREKVVVIAPGTSKTLPLGISRGGANPIRGFLRCIDVPPLFLVSTHETFAPSGIEIGSGH